MPTLREIQRDVARSILAPDDGAALAHIANEGAVAAADRLNIYRNNVATTLVGALRLTYPVVDKLVGPEFFGGVAWAFVARHPPRTACLNNYGAEFADFLNVLPSAAALAYLPDVARLEWAVNLSLNAPDAPTLDVAVLADLAETDHGRVRFMRHPAVRLLSVHYPADAIWRAVLADNGAALGALTLNVDERWLLIQRGREGIVVQHMTQDEARWTSLLFSGAALAEVEPERDSAAFIALLADHLVQGRFAAYTTLSLERPGEFESYLNASTNGDVGDAVASGGSPDMVARVAKDLSFHGDARARLLRGVDILTKAVRVTLGPRGRNVVLGTQFGIGSPRITKDGVTVAKEIELRDKFENMGAQMLREVATKTSHEAGDGTTTATVLAHALIQGGVKAVAAGLSPMELKRGIDDAVKAAVADIKQRSKLVSTLEEIVQVGTISANGDHEIGILLGKAMQKVGSDGVITLQQARSVATSLDFVDGMQFDRGYISPSFVTNQQKLICEMEEPYILLHEQKLTQLQALLPLMEALLRNPKPLLVIADDFAPDVLALLVLNNGRGGLQTAAVRSPRFGEQRQAMLDDIAVLTGGRLFSEERGITLWNGNLGMLGRARSVRVEKENTIIIDGAGKKADILARADLLRAQLADMTTDYDRQRLRERLAKLSSGVAVVRVGGATELELNERRDRVQDALCATRAAMEEGIVAGGGSALLHAGQALAELKAENDDQKAGIDIVRRALRAPVRQIAENSGVDGSVVVGKLLESNDTNQGFDARTGRYVDMIEAGILDPTRVVRLALQHAASIASLLLTTEALIAP